MDDIQMIKKDAQINIQIGVGFLQKLQAMLVSLINEHSQEEINVLNESLKKGETENLQEEWMNNIVTISILISNIEQEAIKQGMTYSQSIEETNLKEN
jgi:hypothetical protein